MKKLLTFFLICLMFATNGLAQYYYVPHLNAGQNPGGLNNDSEYPLGGGLPADWVQINTSPTNTTPVWSPVQNISFPFSFNGTAVTQFKVSSSAILTFDVATALAAPTYTKASLPSASIPDMSVCIWGLAALGTNDNIMMKEFGTAPNRQLWIQFNSYGYGTSASSGSQYTYWSIVLEETSNKIYIVDQRTGGYAATKLVSAGVQIDASTAASVAGSPNLQSLASSDASPGNNTYYEFVQGTQPDYDVAALSITTPAYLLVSTPQNIQGDVINYGVSTITSMDLNYQVDNGAVVTSALTGLNIASFSTYSYVHPTVWTPAVSGTYQVKFWVSNINGNADMNNANDTVTKGFGVASALVQRTVLIEEFTNASCPPCAAQNPAFEAICDANAGKLALIKYHTIWPGVDPMNAFNTTEVADQVNYYNVSGVPHATMDGMAVPGTSYLGAPANVNQTNIDNAYNKPALFDMTLGGLLDITNGQLDVTGSSTSHINFPAGNVKIRVALIEDPVDYATPPGTNGEDHFPHVMRKMLPDPAGTTIPLPVDGQVDNFNFTHIIDPSFVIANLKLVAWIQDDITQEVHQSIMVPIVTTAIDELNGMNAFGIYPNPTSDISKLVFELKQNADVTVAVYNSVGQQVLFTNYGKLNAGKQVLEINADTWSSGLYSVNVTVNGKSNMRKLLIEK